MVRLTQWGLCERELAERAHQATFFDRLVLGELEDIRPPESAVDLRGYIALALRGSYPEVALQASANLRRRWLSSYVDQLVMRDAALYDESRDPVKLRRYLVALASNTAGVVEHKTVYDAAGVSRVTARLYDDLATLLFVADQIPAWHSNRLNRLTRSPKRYLTDSALVGPLLGATSERCCETATFLEDCSIRSWSSSCDLKPRHLHVSPGRTTCATRVGIRKSI